MELRKYQREISKFEEFKEFIFNTKDGVALLTEDSEDEILFRGKDINNLFNIINPETISDIEYINSDYNIFSKKVKAIVKLLDDTKVIIEIL